MPRVYRSGKWVRVAKLKPYRPHGRVHMTGTSALRMDRNIHARHPGRRVSRTGKVYYEARRNRSDKKHWL